MADRVFPAGKPQPLNGSNPPTFPATKGQLYNASRPAFRPTPKPPRRGRGRCCRCCCWVTLVVVTLILLAAVAGAVFYLLYHPQRPSFSVSSLKVSTLNLTAGKVTALVDLAVVARNPNKKLVFLYEPISVAVSASGADIADGEFPAFVHYKKNSTTLKTAITSGGARAVDSDAGAALRSDLKKSALPLTVELETKVRLKMGGVKTEKVGIKVTCDGISAPLPTDKGKSTAASTAGAKCKVKLRIKLWKWQL